MHNNIDICMWSKCAVKVDKIELTSQDGKNKFKSVNIIIMCDPANVIHISMPEDFLTLLYEQIKKNVSTIISVPEGIILS